MDDLPDKQGEVAKLEEAIPAKPPLLNGPKRQHFLPRFYLDGFGREGMLAVYDRTLNEMRVQKPEGTGVIGHFYTLEDNHGRKRFELEQALSEVEDKAAPIIKKLANKEELTADERSDMAIFVALGMCRTPDLIDSIKQMNGHMVKHMTRLMFCSAERAKEILRNGPDAPATEEELEKQAQELVDFVESDQYEVETHHGRPKRSTHSHSITLSSIPKLGYLRLESNVMPPGIPCSSMPAHGRSGGLKCSTALSLSSTGCLRKSGIRTQNRSVDFYSKQFQE